MKAVACSGGGQLQLQRSAKLNDLVLTFWSVSLPDQDFIFCQKHLEQAFSYEIFFTHIHLMIEMFIVNAKSDCCNDLLMSGVHRR